MEEADTARVVEEFEEEEDQYATPSDLYNELLSCGEMILTIPADEEDKLRKGLASVKAKQNAKLRDSGLAPDNSMLAFVSVPSKVFPGAVQVTITLNKRSGIRVLNKEYPDGEF